MGAKMKILIVDDERLILMGLKYCIEKIQDITCEVKTAMSGKQALEILENYSADLMITDVEMPGITGLNLIEYVQHKNLCKRFMVLSGYDKFEYAQRAIRYGVKSYLLKPVDKDELRRDICSLYKEMECQGDLELMKPYQPYFPHLGQQEIPASLRTSVEFIKESYKKDVSLSMLSEYVGKSENYLCSLFKKEWNTTFLELVNEMRLKETLYLLIYMPSIPIRDIAGKVGYKTERQLFRLIKGKLGLTPMQVRNQEDFEKTCAK